jgi:glutamine---fructose-6-phosphate transaminase (isomerizing)
MQVLKQLEGAYALLVQSTRYPGELVCARKGSPVVFAVKKARGGTAARVRHSDDLNEDVVTGGPLECFVASDDKAIIEHSRARISLKSVFVLLCCE